VPSQRTAVAMAFIRWRSRDGPSDHHTMALLLGPVAGYSIPPTRSPLDAVASGGEYLLQRGYQARLGHRRHIWAVRSSDYWHDPDKMMVEHSPTATCSTTPSKPGHWAR